MTKAELLVALKDYGDSDEVLLVCYNTYTIHSVEEREGFPVILAGDMIQLVPIQRGT